MGNNNSHGGNGSKYAVSNGSRRRGQLGVMDSHSDEDKDVLRPHHHHKLYVKRNQVNQKRSSEENQNPPGLLNLKKSIRESEKLPEKPSSMSNAALFQLETEIDRLSTSFRERTNSYGRGGCAGGGGGGGHFWLEKFAKALVEKSTAIMGKGDKDEIIKIAFEHVIPHSPLALNYLWSFFTKFSPHSDHATINPERFIHSAETIYGLITDKEINTFYLRVYSSGGDIISWNNFEDFILSAYQLSSSEANKVSREINRNSDYEGKSWIQSLMKSCFHLKDQMSICFVASWMEKNTPRLIIPMHKYIINRLTTGLSYIENPQLEDDYLNMPNLAKKVEEIKKMDDQLRSPHTPCSTSPPESFQMDAILFWIVSTTLPLNFLSVLDPKPKSEPIRRISPQILSPKEFLKSLMNNHTVDPGWSLLYDSEEQGMSVNRFEFHIFHYRGPTVCLIRTENDYSFLVASDTEWKESCHFWGGENCVILQLSPEYHVVERGAKMIYVNFSIRGYPFGIHFGRDPKNVSLQLQPDFQIAHFKKMPLKVQRLIMWGCAEKEIKSAQYEFKNWEAKECEKRKQVKINKGEWLENPDKYLLELAGGTYKSYGAN